METLPREGEVFSLLRLAANAQTRPDVKRVLERMIRGLRNAGAETVVLKLAGSGDEGLEIQFPKTAGSIADSLVGELLARARRVRSPHVLRVGTDHLPPPFRECRAVPLIPQNGPGGVLCVLSRRRAAFGRVEEERLAAIGQAATLVLDLLQREGMQRRVLVAERERIARELHDGPLQFLVNAVQQLRLAAPPAGRTSLRGAQKNLQEGIHGLREIVRVLRRGSGAIRRLKLEDLVTWFSEIANIPLELEWNVRENLLPSGLQVELFYIIREALTNISHHARAEHVWIKGRVRDGALHVEVRDDGVGFDVSAARRRARGYGLLTLQERATALGGRTTIWSHPGVGTVVKVRVPVVKPAKSGRRSQ